MKPFTDPYLVSRTRALECPNARSSRSLNTTRDGDSNTSLGRPFHCLITLSIKKFFLMFNLNLPGTA